MADQVMWFRRDLRIADHPALSASVAAADGSRVLPLFVLDDALWEPSGLPRRDRLIRSLGALSASLDGALVVRRGRPEDVVPAVAAELGADAVHVTGDAGPYGRLRDERVTAALTGAGRRLAVTGSPYAVGPGHVLNGSGSPYQVFSAFHRAWREHGWPDPAPTPTGVRWARSIESDGLLSVDDEGLPEHRAHAGEEAAHTRWDGFVENGLADYADARDRPDLDGTSRMSEHLKWGEIHPRTLLKDLAGRRGDGARVYGQELAWREFYADVLWHRPESAREYLRPEYGGMSYEEPGEQFEAWCAGRTGFPFVDAGMRQLLTLGWIHNRVRMVVASFLVKDLHLEWQHGARHFLQHLCDGDLASNNHGWQWVAGSGTDAAPYFRIFNPVSQGEKFDPDGSYVRQYVPELAHLKGVAAHSPWDAPDGYAHGYPQRIVDHKAERVDSLARLKAMQDARR
jgi:deoxyribodipyrimidine photo-lyase